MKIEQYPILTMSYIVFMQKVLYVNFRLSTMALQSEETSRPFKELVTTLLRSETEFWKL